MGHYHPVSVLSVFELSHHLTNRTLIALDKRVMLTLSHANSANGRVAEDNSRDILIVHLGVWLVVKETMRQFAPSSNGNWERGRGKEISCPVTE